MMTTISGTRTPRCWRCSTTPTPCSSAPSNTTSGRGMDEWSQDSIHLWNFLGSSENSANLRFEFYGTFIGWQFRFGTKFGWLWLCSSAMLTCCPPADTPVKAKSTRQWNNQIMVSKWQYQTWIVCLRTLESWFESVLRIELWWLLQSPLQAPGEEEASGGPRVPGAAVGRGRDVGAVRRSRLQGKHCCEGKVC